MTEIIIPLLYGASGFFLSFFLSRAVNIAIVTCFLYVTFKTLEKMHVKMDMNGLERLSVMLGEFGRTIVTLAIGIIHTTNTTALLLFITGGVVGIITNLSRR